MICHLHVFLIVSPTLFTILPIMSHRHQSFFIIFHRPTLPSAVGPTLHFLSVMFHRSSSFLIFPSFFIVLHHFSSVSIISPTLPCCSGWVCLLVQYLAGWPSAGACASLGDRKRSPHGQILSLVVLSNIFNFSSSFP